MVNFIELFNEISKLARPAHADSVFAKDMNDRFVDIGLDSLDALVILMYITEVYGVEEETCKEWTPTTLQELHDLLMANKTREPSSVKDAVEACK